MKYISAIFPIMLLLAGCSTQTEPENAPIATEIPAAAGNYSNAVEEEWDTLLSDKIRDIVLSHVPEDAVIKHVEVESLRTNFSNDDINYQNDLLTIISVKTDWWKNDMTIYVAEVRDSAYETVCAKKFANGSIRLVSLLGDCRNQFVVESSSLGRGSLSYFVWIYNYNKDTNQFDLIFNEGLDEYYPQSDYQYHNEYKFVKSDAGDNIYDIVLNTVTRTADKLVEPVNDADFPGPKYNNQFRFDGSKYVLLGELQDYRLPFKEVSEELGEYWVELERE